MMHMIKLCVGISTLEELESYRSERAHWWGADYGEGVHVHRTRMMPKRAEEIEGIGSIYWVISGKIRCRQPILAVETLGEGQATRCEIIVGLPVIRTHAAPRRPFQGWRYFKPEEAPPDLQGDDGDDTAPPELVRQLRELGAW